MARLHGRITAAMSHLSPARNAIVVCVSCGRSHHEKQRCEQRRSGDSKFLRSRSHLFFLFALPERNRPQKIPRRASAPRFMIAQLSATPGFAIMAIRIAAMPNAFLVFYNSVTANARSKRALRRCAHRRRSQNNQIENDWTVCAGCGSTLYARDAKFAVESFRLIALSLLRLCWNRARRPPLRHPRMTCAGR